MAGARKNSYLSKKCTLKIWFEMLFLLFINVIPHITYL